MGKVLIVPTQTVPHDTSAVIEFTLKDPAGVFVAGANVSSATLDIRQESDASSIGATGRDVTSKVNSSGLFHYVVPAADNKTLLTSPPAGDVTENHVVTIILNFISGSDTHKLTQNFLIRVEANPMV